MRKHRSWVPSLMVVLAVSATGARVAAEEPAECRKWFPDLSANCDRPSRFAGFSAPGPQGFYFEDPFINTGLSAWALWNEYPDTSVFDGGHLRALAAQLRVAITDRLAFIATKDGYIENRPDLKLLEDEEGWGDLSFGFKYALVYRPDERFILTPSLRYEMTQGSRDVLQGNGEGVWIPGLSTGLGLGRAHLVGSMGARLPVDGDAESSVFFYHAQVGYPVSQRFVPFVGLNGLYYIDAGRGTTTIGTKIGRLSVDTVQTALDTGRFEGIDLANLGSRGVDEHNWITFSVGFRFEVFDGIDLGLTYERPLTNRRYIMKQRVTLNLLVEL